MATALARRRSKRSPVAVPPAESAKQAGLRYVNDDKPGIRRVGSGKSFRYVGADGKAVRDADALARIRSLAIPPAWKDVWICPHATGHLQATGRDARGRKQYRYHPRWREVRDGATYDRMVAFGNALPVIRATTERHLKLPDLPREKVLATVVRFLEMTHIRVGNDEYAKSNHSYGLTTLHDQHAHIDGSTVRFSFRGKGGIRHEVELHDRRLAKIVRGCQELPGQELFQYVGADGAVHDIGSQDVNDYLREITGEEFTAKDFRTWSGTVLAACELSARAVAASMREAKRNVVAAVRQVAERLGNTVAVCRKCYIHPAVLDGYLGGQLAKLRLTVSAKASVTLELRPEESAVLGFLQAASL
ncbi:MAG TPA: DNA topoisomerase IB [Gemmataceae bacterium]|jgi:DNA topoisomerase-1|nr:DNA topoisomerase IB [Gemmataceae bacterium]